MKISDGSMDGGSMRIEGTRVELLRMAAQIVGMCIDTEAEILRGQCSPTAYQLDVPCGQIKSIHFARVSEEVSCSS